MFVFADCFGGEWIDNRDITTKGRVEKGRVATALVYFAGKKGHSDDGKNGNDK